jgi:hypothetical protein
MSDRLLSVPPDQEREARRCLEQGEVNQEPLRCSRSRHRGTEAPKRLVLLLKGARGLSAPLEQEARCLEQEQDYGSKRGGCRRNHPIMMMMIIIIIMIMVAPPGKLVSRSLIQFQGH